MKLFHYSLVLAAVCPWVSGAMVVCVAEGAAAAGGRPAGLRLP